MGNKSIPEDLRYLSFLKHDKAPALFNKLYDTLRSGIHIQKQSHPDLFDFIESENNEDNIAEFIRLFNETQMLSRKGQQNEKYYFIDFIEGANGNTEKDYIENDFLLVGFLIYKVYILDGIYDEWSISSFQKTLLQDYEGYKPNIIKNLAKNKRTASNEQDDETIKERIRGAFRFFNKICWLKLDSDNDGFTFYPAFQRLIDSYSSKINDINNWNKE